MDTILEITDVNIFSPYLYNSRWPTDDPIRQSISLFIIIIVMCYSIYFLFSTISYFLIFRREIQCSERIYTVKAEIKSQLLQSFTSLPLMVLPSVPIFLLEVRGYSCLYDDTTTPRFGILDIVSQTILFILMTDICVYWIHRCLHKAMFYKFIHKHHHKWKAPTPFAGHAVHPLDGFLQMLPYHLYVFVFPLHKWIFICVIVIVNIWTVCVHDGGFPVPQILQPFVNCAADHKVHHLLYTYNYGHLFTLWDKSFGTYRS